MEIQNDFKELLGLLNKNKVEYIVVEAFALAFHGVPRLTGDIDVYLRPTPENADRVQKTLNEFGFGSLGLKASDFSRPEQIIQLGHPPVRIDLITSISGVTWEEANKGKVPSQYGDVPIHYLGARTAHCEQTSFGPKKRPGRLGCLWRILSRGSIITSSCWMTRSGRPILPTPSGCMMEWVGTIVF